MINRKPTKRWMVEEWTHAASGAVLRIYYHKGTRKFWAPVAHKEVEAGTQEEAKQKANKLANVLLASEDKWRRIILIEVVQAESQTHYGGYAMEQSHNSPHIGFTCLRTWVLDAEDGQRYMRSWDREPTNRYAREKVETFQDVRRFSRYLGKDARELPYSDELWMGLMVFSDRLDQVRVRLKELIDDDDQMEHLLENALGLLKGKGE
jgi:hypothetical protein